MQTSKLLMGGVRTISAAELQRWLELIIDDCWNCRRVYVVLASSGPVLLLPVDDLGGGRMAPREHPHDLNLALLIARKYQCGDSSIAGCPNVPHAQ